MKNRSRTKEAFSKALRSFAAITPMLLAVIGLVGLYQAFVSPEMLHMLFGGSRFFDTLVGTVAGGISVGQPVLSYIIGGEMLTEGISVAAVAAFVLAWVTLGLIQLPMEASLFGMRFMIVRNLLAFVFALLIGWATDMTLQGIA